MEQDEGDRQHRRAGGSLVIRPMKLQSVRLRESISDFKLGCSGLPRRVLDAGWVEVGLSGSSPGPPLIRLLSLPSAFADSFQHQQ